ncbi:MAG TPA: prolipoprotein diacylglyceryl transferase family protein [Acidimicrobiia bacterium]|nr:prolipoprotein diacylglyceryl transferase family protein [Acidimicrobiia bacterium]
MTASPEVAHEHRHLLEGSRKWLISPWWAFLTLGIAVGLIACELVFDPRRMRLVPSVPFLPLVMLCGYVVAGVWWRIVHHRPWWRLDTGGLCIQGALFGGLTAAVAGVWASGDSPVYFLDALMPGLFVGMSVARFGCLCAGCCAGRPSESRWALWSYSGRHGEGARRIPTQPLESLLCLGVAVGALALQAPEAGSGTVLVAAVAAYALGRQVLLPRRDQQREPSFARASVLALSTAVLLGDLLLISVG